jgi:hypothetical protein
VPKRLETVIGLSQDDPEKISTTIDEAISYANGEIMALGQIDPVSG